jgi:DNA-binding IscR family transcriptional regulator
MARAFSNSDNQYILQSVNCNFQNEYEQTSDCTNQRMVLEVESKLRLRLNPYMVEDMISVL